MAKLRHTDQEFAAIYVNCATLDEAAQLMGYSPGYIIQRAAALGLQLSTQSTDQQLFARLMEAYCQMSPEWRRRAKEAITLDANAASAQ